MAEQEIRIRLLVDGFELTDLNGLITQGEPPPDAIGIKVLVEDDGEWYEVLKNIQKVDGKAVSTRIVAKFWRDQLGEYHTRVC